MSDPVTPRKRRKAAFQGSYSALDGGTSKDSGYPRDSSDENYENQDAEDLFQSDEDPDDVIAADDGDDVDLDEPKTPKRRGRPQPRKPLPPRTPRTPSDLDKSARKRATKVLLNLASGAGTEDDLEEEEQLMAERIILESRGEDAGGKATPILLSPRKSVAEVLETEKGAQALFLDGFEGYFDQHKSREMFSSTPFSHAPDITYQQFVQYVQESRVNHSQERQLLTSIYKTMYPQWYFELTQGYSLVFYGVGSKRNLIMDFVAEALPHDIKTLIVNGYNPAITFKEILLSAVSVFIPPEIRKNLPKNPPDLLSALLKYLADGQTEEKLIIAIHNIDGDSLRVDREHDMLARLISAKQIWLVSSIDHIEAPVLWDAAKISQYNFLWHDVTTYELYTVETSFEDPLALGKNRSAVGRKGAKYVLSSLTANARNLFRVLASFQLEVMTEDLSPDDIGTVGTAKHGVEFNTLYHKCVEEFIVSVESNFRNLLKEFIDHKMAATSKDPTGVEIIYIPFTKDQLESAVEDLVDM